MTSHQELGGGGVIAGGDDNIKFDDNEPNADSATPGDEGPSPDAEGENADPFEEFQDPATSPTEESDGHVRVRVTEDHRVVIDSTEDNNMEDESNHDIPSDETRVPMESPASRSPKPSRRRLRPLREHMDTGKQSSPEPQQARGSKSSRNEEEMELAVEHLEELRTEAEVERDRVDRRMLAMALNGVDVTEVFSPPRVVQMAVRMGMIGGQSMDLKTGWDFSMRSDRKKAVEMILREDPWLVVGSPPCTMFSMLQNLNVRKFWHIDEWRKAFDEKKRAAEEHVRFYVQLYRLQISRGRYFLHEHPDGATSWDLQMMADMEKIKVVIRVQTDQCMSGLTTEVKGVVQPARKRTGFLANSPCIGEELRRKCDGSHEHFTPMEGRASEAEEYPPALCKAVCRGIQKQQMMNQTGMCCALGVESTELEEVLTRAGYPGHWIDKQHKDSLDDDQLMKEIFALRIKNGGQAWATDDLYLGLCWMLSLSRRRVSWRWITSGEWWFTIRWIEVRPEEGRSSGRNGSTRTRGIQ